MYYLYKALYHSYDEDDISVVTVVLDVIMTQVSPESCGVYDSWKWLVKW